VVTSFLQSNAGTIIVSGVFFLLTIGATIADGFIRGRQAERERLASARSMLIDVVERKIVDNEPVDWSHMSALLRAVERESRVRLHDKYDLDRVLEDVALRFERTNYIGSAQRGDYLRALSTIERPTAPDEQDDSQSEDTYTSSLKPSVAESVLSFVRLRDFVRILVTVIAALAIFTMFSTTLSTFYRTYQGSRVEMKAAPIPNLVGRSLKEATAQAKRLGFGLELAPGQSSGEDSQSVVVVGQRPDPSGDDEQWSEGTTINVRVAPRVRPTALSLDRKTRVTWESVTSDDGKWAIFLSFTNLTNQRISIPALVANGALPGANGRPGRWAFSYANTPGNRAPLSVQADGWRNGQPLTLAPNEKATAVISVAAPPEDPSPASLSLDLGTPSSAYTGSLDWP